MSIPNITNNPIHLGLGSTASIEPLFTGSMDWYMDYMERHEADGAEGRLVSMHTFSKPWDTWEMHPKGSEVVICIAGAIALLQEKEDGSVSRIQLNPGQYIINEPGIWHTADIEDTATALFITAGLGTELRPR